MTIGRRSSRRALQLAEALIILVCFASYFAVEAKAAPVISNTAEIVVPLTMKEVMNDKTTGLMTLSKCGVKDDVGRKINDRSKRYVLIGGTKWEHKSLTYQVRNYPRSLDKTSVDKEIAKAFAVWSQYTDLTFTKKTGPVDIWISFESQFHGDIRPFDGPGGSLAHASSPIPGYEAYAHFDDDEVWSINSYDGENLFKVAVHEIGHNLGLGHNDDESSIMWSFVAGYDPEFRLNNDDIAGIQALYGRKTGHEDPQICDDPRIDTMFHGAEDEIYVFQGQHYWKLTDEGTAPGYPKLIADTWTDLPSNIDAAFTYNERTYFFKDSRYWVYVEDEMEQGYPRKISDGFPGIPANIDAVTVSTEYNKIFFFKGNKFWKIDSVWKPSMRRAYPISIAYWPGLPKHLDAALSYNGDTYFFKNDVYYRFDHRTSSMDRASPSETKTKWFGCLSDEVDH